jgi:hypothetical protein
MGDVAMNDVADTVVKTGIDVVDVENDGDELFTR